MADAALSRTALEKAGGNGPGSALERATSMMSEGRARMMAMPPGQRRWLGVSALLLGALCAGMMWYSGRTDWRTLFSGLDTKDVQQTAQELSSAGIAYELTEDGGGVRVGADQLDKARMEVATKGMPQSGRMGFELFDKPNWVGSEFDEKVNYQRAMEGELEHTIGTLAAVRSARVHLVLPKDSMFSGEAHEAKASVVLKLRKSALPPEQVESIRNMVAGAVENLSPEQVTLVDADGRVNLGAPSKDVAAGGAERALEEKLVAMLEPTAGRDNVRATVNVSYDETSLEKTDEVYDPAQTATLTMQRSEQSTVPGAKAAGIPGTASNTPAPAAAGSAAAAAGPAANAPAVPPLMQVGAPGAPAAGGSGLPVYPTAGGGQVQTAKEENGTYGVTKHMTHLEQGPGRVRRLTAAVVVNDRMTTEGEGKTEHAVWKPRSTDEMRRLNELARAAVGFDTARGDEVVIENVSFSSNVPEVKPPMLEKLMDEGGALLHAEPGLLKTLSFAALSLLLVIVVLRPMTRGILAALAPPVAPRLLAAAAAADRGDGSGSAAVQVQERVAGETGSNDEPESRQRPGAVNGQLPEGQGIFAHVSEQIRKEPAQSARLVESWISAPTKERG